MRAAPFRRSDVVAVTVTYADGSQDVVTEEEVRVGSAVVWTTRDSPGKDQKEWDVFEVHVSGQKRSLTREG